MLREVQERIQRQEIDDQVRQLRVQADEACSREHFDSALGFLDRALNLDKNNQELRRLRESGWLAGTDQVVVLNTGTGLKYPHTMPRDGPAMTHDRPAMTHDGAAAMTHDRSAG